MLKKIISLSLALCMILSLAAITPVWAEETISTETFETDQNGVITSSYSGDYYTSSAGVLVKRDAATYNTQAGALTLATTGGYNGTRGLMLKPGTQYGSTSVYFRPNSLVTDSYTLDDTNEVILEFKIKFNALPEAVNVHSDYTRVWAYIGVVDVNSTLPNYEIRNNYDYNPVSMQFGTDESTAVSEAKKFNLTSDEVTIGDWYTVVTTARKGEPASTTIYDEQGNTVISASATANLDTTVKFRPVFTPAVPLSPYDDTVNTADEYNIVVDNISVTQRTRSAEGTTIEVDGTEYTVTQPEGEALVATGCKPSGTVTSLSMTIDGETVKVAKNAWQVDSEGVLKISNSLITEGAEFTTSTATADATEVSVQTLKVGKNDAQSSLYMLGKITGVPAKYGVRLGCTVDGLSGDYDAAGTNAAGEFLVELGYGSKLPTGAYNLTAYADSATGKTGTVTITE